MRFGLVLHLCSVRFDFEKKLNKIAPNNRCSTVNNIDQGENKGSYNKGSSQENHEYLFAHQAKKKIFDINE